MDERLEQNEHAEERNQPKEEINIPFVMAKGDADEKEITGSMKVATNDTLMLEEDSNEVTGNESSNDDESILVTEED